MASGAYEEVEVEEESPQDSWSSVTWLSFYIDDFFVTRVM